MKKFILVIALLGCAVAFVLLATRDGGRVAPSASDEPLGQSSEVSDGALTAAPTPSCPDTSRLVGDVCRIDHGPLPQPGCPEGFADAAADSTDTCVRYELAELMCPEGAKGEPPGCWVQPQDILWQACSTGTVLRDRECDPIVGEPEQDADGIATCQSGEPYRGHCIEAQKCADGEDRFLSMCFPRRELGPYPCDETAIRYVEGMCVAVVDIDEVDADGGPECPRGFVAFGAGRCAILGETVLTTKDLLVCPKGTLFAAPPADCRHMVSPTATRHVCSDSNATLVDDRCAFSAARVDARCADGEPFGGRCMTVVAEAG